MLIFQAASTVDTEVILLIFWDFQGLTLYILYGGRVVVRVNIGLLIFEYGPTKMKWL